MKKGAKTRRRGKGVLEPPEFRSLLPQFVLDSLHEAVYFVDTECRIQYWNRGAEELTGYAAEEALGRVCWDNFLAHSDESGCSLCTKPCSQITSQEAGRGWERETFLRHKMGHRIPVNLRVCPVRDGGGKVIGTVEVIRDLTRSKATERRVLELEKLAFRDFLTGLPNRYYTEHKVQQALQDRTHFGRDYGLLMIDLDDFKRINDTYGHNAGDLVLRAVCRELTRGLRSADLVGRWGGEEFLLLAADTSPEALAELAERCRVLVAGASVEWQGSVLNLTASLGATLLRKDEDSTTAVDRADKLMYESKRKGGNRYTIEFETTEAVSELAKA